MTGAFMEFPLYSLAPKRLTPSSAWVQHIPFAMYLIQVLRPEILVELGVYNGDSYCSFCQAVQELKLNTRCFAVDTWRGDEQGGFFGSEVLEDLQAHHDPLYGSFSSFLQCSFDDALPNFADGTIDLLHIDGYHTYAAVKHDFDSWLPKMSRRGVILLHDTTVRERSFGVWRVWDEVKQAYPNFSFPHGHGLGVLGVGKDQPKFLLDLFQASKEESAAIHKFFLQLGERITLQVRDEAELIHLRLQIADKETQLDQIKASNGWRALQYYYKLRETFLPQGSLLRKMAAFLGQLADSRPVTLMRLKKFIWYCRIYGFLNALRLALRKMRQPGVLNLKIRPLSLPSATIASHEEELPPINKKVSIVIPTKNAGGAFHFLLKKLKSQKGLREFEIIIVDSGSNDGTIELAKTEGVKIIEISPESFNHAYARNKGAEVAAGDYVLFLVQDALPLTDKWLWEMTKTLEQNNTVAVSCAEYPTSDCDLFYQHLIWNHYRTLNLDKDRFLSWDESCSSQLGLRSNSQISDIASLIKLDVFNQYKFKLKFAEDLDLGIRLIKDGHRIGFLYSTRVLHSHNRPAHYFLKRAYVDSKFIKILFPDCEVPAISNQTRLFHDIIAIYFRTKSVASELSKTNASGKVSSIFDRIKYLYSVEHIDCEHPSPIGPDIAFEDFINFLAIKASEKDIIFKSKDNILLPHFLEHLGVLQAFITASHLRIEETLMRDLSNALYKILALHSGSHMAYLYLTLLNQRQSDDFLSGLDKQLASGI
jgi:glycosyltransferase involved in cell wall biosynthesis